MTTLVRVAKDGATLLVHPTTVEDHVHAGWAVSTDQTDVEDIDAVDPLDHDGDGEKGGSVAADPELTALRKQYREKFGKGPGPKWTAEQIADKLAGTA